MRLIDEQMNIIINQYFYQIEKIRNISGDIITLGSSVGDISGIVNSLINRILDFIGFANL